MNDAVALDEQGDAGPGSMLRRARASRGLSEQQAAEQLNLDVSIVAALERDDFAALGAPVFAKGHLRRYGAMLGLVTDELLAAYERAGGQSGPPVLVPRARQEMPPVRGRPKWPWVVGSGLLFLLAAGVAAYVSEYGLRWPSGGPEQVRVPGRGPGGASVAEPAAADVAAPGPLQEAAAATTDAPVPDSPGAAASEAPALPVPPGHVSVSLAFAADSWAEIYDGSGQAVLYDLGRAGTQRSIAAAAPLSVTIGNTPGVTLAVNGRRVSLPAVPGAGTVARFKIEADGTVR